MPRPYRRDPMARILAHVEPEPNTGCWLWSGRANAAGYGTVTFRRRDQLAHRVAFELLRAPIPAGLVLDHLCRVRCCVNPDHLEPVTQAVNVRRAEQSISQVNVAKTHCPQGHSYDQRNTGTRIDRGGIPARKCRTCNRLAEAERRRQRTPEERKRFHEYQMEWQRNRRRARRAVQHVGT
jgi:hypothetical protein